MMYLISAIALLLLSLIAETSGSVVLIVSALLIALGGIPHGAVDLHLTLPGAQRRRELGVYLASISIVLLGWYLWPPLMLGFFLLNSAWHFGDCDLQTSHRAKPLLAVLYGSAILITLVRPDDPSVRWIIMDLAGAADIVTMPDLVRWLAFALVLVMPIWTNPSNGFQQLFRSTVIIGMGLWAPSLVAFTWYFVFIHSWSSVDRLRDYLSPEKPLEWVHVLKAAAPLSVVTYAGIALGYMLLPAASLVALLFVALSALTLPHSRLFSRVYAQSR